MESASRRDPLNDFDLIRLAQRLEEDGQPSLAAWRRAIAVNPRRDLSLTQAAIAAELAGDTAGAERLLLQAEEFNHLWLPRWSLANFYARRGRPRETFRWARAALERSYGDPGALFVLCRQAGASEGQMLGEILPAAPTTLSAYVYFLIRQNEPDGLELAALAYLRAARQTGVDPLETGAAAVTALIRAGQAEPALRLWAKLPLPYPVETLTNPALRPPLRPAAFDWQIPAVPGVETLRGVPDKGIKFTFSGQQPELAELLAQDLYLPGSGPWTLRFEYQTLGFTHSKSGLRWTLAGTGEGPALALSDEWQSAAATWTVTPGLHRLALVLGRETGQPRIEGELRLRGLQLRSGTAP